MHAVVTCLKSTAKKHSQKHSHTTFMRDSFGTNKSSTSRVADNMAMLHGSHTLFTLQLFKLRQLG
jgi:hypothetical protein